MFKYHIQQPDFSFDSCLQVVCLVCAGHVSETHLADAASLTEGADGAHVALVARAEGRGMEGGRVQRDTRVRPHISCGLQVVALAEQGDVEGEGGGGGSNIKVTHRTC